MINPPLNKTLGVITFSTCGKQPNLHRLFRVNSGVPIRDALEFDGVGGRPFRGQAPSHILIGVQPSQPCRQ